MSAVHRELSPVARRAAEDILSYLAEVDPAPAKVDAIIGFGMFDLALPRFCAELFSRGLARSLIFTGGVGAGTGDLGGAEADVWRDEVRRSHPEIGADDIIIENRSTNTAENIRFTSALLESHYPEQRFGDGIRAVTVVASPSRLRRVRLTLRQLVPAVAVTRRLPSVNFEREAALYERQGVPYVPHLLGELERIQTYPAKGWITAEPLPAAVRAAAEALKRLTQPWPTRAG